jgi:heat shock protein HslJ
MGPIILLSRRPCAAEVLAQERAFLAALRSATRVELEGSQLLLTRGDDTRIGTFTAAPTPALAPPAEQPAAATS